MAHDQGARARGPTQDPPHRPVPLLRPPLAARRPHRRGHRRGPDRSEEPRLRRHRGDPAAERSVRRGRRRDPVRDLRHEPADLDWARARAWRRWPRAPSLAAGITGEQDVASFVAGITLASGVLFLLLAVFKMGWIAQFLSRAVVTGFLFGAAIDVVIGELPKLTGTEVTGSNPLQELRSWFGYARRRPADHRGGGRRRAGRRLRAAGGRAPRPRRPGPGGRRSPGLVALRPRRPGRGPGRRRAQRAAVARGPRRPADGDHAGTVALAAVALVLIGFSQTAGDARAFAAKHRYQIDINQESVAQAHGQHRRRAVPGDARLDEPVRELAQRPLRGDAPVSPRSPPASPSCSRCSSWRRCSRTCPSRCWPR